VTVTELRTLCNACHRLDELAAMAATYSPDAGEPATAGFLLCLDRLVNGVRDVTAALWTAELAEAREARGVATLCRVWNREVRS
jgi:hypothetical protein